MVFDLSQVFFGISFLLTYALSTVPLFNLYISGYGELDLSDLMSIPFTFDTPLLMSSKHFFLSSNAFYLG